jgi:hypothetical protein
MLAIELIVFFLYVFWLLFSILAQGETALNKKIHANDHLFIIPSYHFFCPSPTQHDYNLYYRTQSHDESWSKWIRLEIKNHNSYFSLLWNPYKRERKFFSKIVNVLKDYPKRKKSKQPGYFYKLVLYVITNRISIDQHKALQFKITYIQTLNTQAEEKTLYESEPHMNGAHI